MLFRSVLLLSVLFLVLVSSSCLEADACDTCACSALINAGIEQTERRHESNGSNRVQSRWALGRASCARVYLERSVKLKGKRLEHRLLLTFSIICWRFFNPVTLVLAFYRGGIHCIRGRRAVLLLKAWIIDC